MLWSVNLYLLFSVILEKPVYVDVDVPGSQATQMVQPTMSIMLKGCLVVCA